MKPFEIVLEQMEFVQRELDKALSSTKQCGWCHGTENISFLCERHQEFYEKHQYDD